MPAASRFKFAPIRCMVLVFVSAVGVATPAAAATAPATVPDNTPPQLTITSPSAGESYRGGEVVVDASASDDDQIAGVTGTLDGVAIPVPDRFPADNLAPGTHTLVVTARDRAGNVTTDSASFSTAVAPRPPAAYYHGQLAGRRERAPVLVAAGDVACEPGQPATPTTCQQAGTAELVQSLHPDAVAVLADEQYEIGTLSNFNAAYGPTWGAFRGISQPAAGNHEYAQDNYPGAQAAGYFDYFNGPGKEEGRAGDRQRGYYSYDIGAWHVVVLNSECGVVSCKPGSGQQRWLTADLREHQSRCTLAYWHEPLFTDGVTEFGANNLASRDLWDTLYRYGADVILNGHDHNYQRYAPQAPDGTPDPARGIREFVVGTGGKSLFDQPHQIANLEAHDHSTFGALRLRLERSGYAWRFVPESGHGHGNATFTDQGSANCHGSARAVHTHHQRHGR